MKNILMISWYNFDRKFGGTQRCLGIFNNLNGQKYLLSYNNNKSNIDNYFYVKSFLGKYSKYFQMLVYFLPINIYKVFTILKNKNIDIIFAESIWTLFPIILFKKVFKYKIFFDTHNFEYEYYKQKNSKLSFLIFYIEKYCCIFSDKILVCSEREKSLFIETYNLNKNKVFILKNGLNFPEIRKEKKELKKELNIDNKKIILSFIGKLDYLPNKEAVDFLIKNINNIQGNIILLIIGPGGENYKIDSKKIIKIGYVENVYGYINISDICLSPIFKGSGTRLKILEYIALNKTIVSTEKGHEGIVLNEVTGLYSSNEFNFIEVLNDIINKKEFLTENNNINFIEKYLWENLINNFIKNENTSN